MYGLSQSGLIANEFLEKRFNKHGYQKSKLVPKLWKNDWKLEQFTLVVDDFGVKCMGEEHTLHLKQTLEDNYKVATEVDSTRYIGITLDWDYRRIQVHLSMLGYTNKALKQFNHTKTKNKTTPKHTHHIWCQKTICDTTIHSAAT